MKRRILLVGGDQRQRRLLAEGTRAKIYHVEAAGGKRRHPTKPVDLVVFWTKHLGHNIYGRIRRQYAGVRQAHVSTSTELKEIR